MPCMSYTRFSDDSSVDYVGPDDVRGGRLAASHLLGHGARTFVFVGSRAQSSASRMRRAGLEGELADAGLAGTLRVLDQEMTPAGGYAAARALLDSGPLPDAVVCVSDTVAFGLFDGLREASTRAYPRVIGFDDVELAAYSSPRLTTVSSHPDSLGQLAASTFVDRLTGGADVVAGAVHRAGPRGPGVVRVPARAGAGGAAVARARVPSRPAVTVDTF